MCFDWCKRNPPSENTQETPNNSHSPKHESGPGSGLHPPNPCPPIAGDSNSGRRKDTIGSDSGKKHPSNPLPPIPGDSNGDIRSKDTSSSDSGKKHPPNPLPPIVGDSYGERRNDTISDSAGKKHTPNPLPPIVSDSNGERLKDTSSSDSAGKKHPPNDSSPFSNSTDHFPKSKTDFGDPTARNAGEKQKKQSSPPPLPEKLKTTSENNTHRFSTTSDEVTYNTTDEFPTSAHVEQNTIRAQRNIIPQMTAETPPQARWSY
ncbi:hypothetical protein FRX31_015294 [Thalictrum thalictroides]|uniref:Uncharacterized protein n=1 Tax=Thalictrum thalictroides TaxID=46969 RepID=A0A7J6WFC7_THATH|nr:hypothetical protein FRX31_015294 [Thalictrum thalictroides]